MKPGEWRANSYVAKSISWRLESVKFFYCVGYHPVTHDCETLHLDQSTVTC